MNNQILHSEINHLELLNRGKVRDIHVLGDDHLLIVTTDRISAFDVILNQPIPGKGGVLNRISNFWFNRISHLLPNHLSDMDLSEAIPNPEMRHNLGDRAIIVKKLKPLPIEAIVRGYLIGSGWKDYQATGSVCGITLPEKLRQADQLPEAIFTPSTKAEAGEHDQNISYDECVRLLGDSLAEKVRNLSLQIYTEAAIYARGRGIVIADTKFEFGIDDAGVLYLIDEVLTPDSSRFWPVSHYEPGSSPPSYDKQFVRDYLETLDWNKRPPAPDLPENIIQQTADKYREAELSLTGK